MDVFEDVLGDVIRFGRMLGTALMWAWDCWADVLLDDIVGPGCFYG